MCKYFLAICLLFLTGCKQELALPDDKKQAIQKAFSSTFGIEKPDFKSLQSIDGGASADGVYKTEVNGKAYVIRFMPQRNALPARLHEIESLKAAAQAGLSPAVQYANAEDRIVVLSFISKKEFTGSRAQWNDQETDLIKKIHAIPNPKPYPVYGDLFGFINAIATYLPMDQFPSYVADGAAYAQKLQNDFKTCKKVFSHNDLNPNNLIYDGQKIWAVDWENASQSCYMHDLATFSIFSIMTPDEEKKMLTRYLEHEPDQKTLNQFSKMKQVQRVFYGIALLITAHMKKTPPPSQTMIDEVIPLDAMIKGIGKGTYTLSNPQHMEMAGLSFLKDLR